MATQPYHNIDATILIIISIKMNLSSSWKYILPILSVFFLCFLYSGKLVSSPNAGKVLQNNVYRAVKANVSAIEKFKVEHKLSRKSSEGILKEEPKSDWKNTLKAFCTKRGNARNAFTAKMLVDDKNKIIMCNIPKVGCTHWKQFLLRNINPKIKIKDYMSVHYDSYLSKHGLRGLQTYTPAQRNYRLRTYFKFMFVRNPYARLYSGFKNKINPGTEVFFKKIWAPRIAQSIRRNKSDHSAISFSEFLQFVVKENGYNRANEHWNTYQRLCNPCAVRYDFVGKMENMNEDTKQVLKIIRSNLTFPAAYNSYNDTAQKYRTIVKTIPADLLSQVKKTFADDFSLFNYSNIFND